MTTADPARPTPLAGSLSGRETQVIDLIARGLSNDDIVEATSLSINSVKSFIRSAYQKIGVERRPQAVRWAIEHGFGRGTVPGQPLSQSLSQPLSQPLSQRG